MTTSDTTTTAEGEVKQPYQAFNPHHPRLAIKHGGMFLVTDTQGMIPGETSQGFGLYLADTRWLSRLMVTIAGEPLTLQHGETEDGFAASFVYVNPSGTLVVERDLVINEGLTERYSVKNNGTERRNLELTVDFDNDFADMFEVRGAVRKQRGNLQKPRVTSGGRRVTLSYTGVDSLKRRTFIDFIHPRPQFTNGERAVFKLDVEPGQSVEVLFHITARLGSGRARPRPLVTFEQEYAIACARLSGWMKFNATIATDNTIFNSVLARAYGDIYSLRQEDEFGFCLAAGVPWFVCGFGRDDFITALQTLRYMPWLSAEILEYFTHYQGKKFEAETEEEPGKMPHEIRVGEMARCAEIAFRPYYGTVDATQLWLMLMGEYVKQTGDLDLPTRLWKHIVAAERFLARNTKDGANFIFYGGKPGQALTNTCWKDSGNSMVYADGTCPDKDVSIAVCEAQGYLYQAWTATAALARLIGRKRFEQRMRVKAARLKARFEKEFWMADKGFVAMAVDSNGRQLDVISSNPGHLLSTGILSREAELKVADRLMHEDMFSGWGIRTLAASEKAFNPDDYQVGSIWPHDNGFAASAMSVLGRPQHAKAVFKGMFDTASHHSDLRLPELFGGQDRVPGEPPVPYQVACVPQAWAAGCWFHMLSGMMNIVPDAPAKRVDIIHPDLPEWLGTVRVTGLRIADAELDLEFAPREGGKSACRVTRLVGELEVQITCD